MGVLQSMVVLRDYTNSFTGYSRRLHFSLCFSLSSTILQCWKWVRSNPLFRLDGEFIKPTWDLVLLRAKPRLVKKQVSSPADLALWWRCHMGNVQCAGRNEHICANPDTDWPYNDLYDGFCRLTAEDRKRADPDEQRVPLSHESVCHHD